MKKLLNNWPPKENMVNVTWEYTEKEFDDSVTIKTEPGGRNFTKNEDNER